MPTGPCQVANGQIGASVGAWIVVLFVPPWRRPSQMHMQQKSDSAFARQTEGERGSERMRGRRRRSIKKGRERERPKSDILGGVPFYPIRSLSLFAGSDK